MKQIFEFLITRFLRPEVDAIVASFHKYIARLEAAAEAHALYAAKQEEKANAAMKARLTALEESAKASAVAAKFRDITGA